MRHAYFLMSTLVCLLLPFACLSFISCSGPENSKDGAEASAKESTQKVASDIPAEVRKIVFEEGNFAAPVAVRLPMNTDKAWVENLRKTGGIVVYGYLDKNDAITKLLAAQGLIEVSEARGDYYAHYTEKLRQHMDPAVFNATGGQWTAPKQLNVAFRRLKEITYKKAYQAEGMPFFSLTFTYEFQETIPGFPHVVEIFTGKAKTYQDMDDGLWKIESLQLSDNDWSEYAELAANLPKISEIALRPDPKEVLRKNFENISGNWEGAEQMYILRRVKLSLTSSESSGISGTIEFPAYECSWTLALDRSDMDALFFKQTSRTGKNCGNFEGYQIPEGMGVRIHARPEQNQNKLNVSFYYPNNKPWVTVNLTKIPEGLTTAIASEID